MASTAVISAFSARIATNWTYTDIIDPNTIGGVPLDNAAFLEVLYPVTSEMQLSFGQYGNNAHEEMGAVRVGLYVPIGEGLNPAATPWMDRIMTLMQQFRGVRFSGIDCLGFVGPTARDDSDDGNYYEISFAVSYRYILFG